MKTVALAVGILCGLAVPALIAGYLILGLSLIESLGAGRP